MNTYFPPFTYMFFLLFGTLVTASSSSLFGMWMGLEINLMSFIPMIINSEYNKKSSEAAIMYFLVQAIASSLVIFSTMLFFLYSSQILQSSPNLVITLALCTKLGMAPFHLWFPEVLSGLSWVNTLILLTWQKISPLIVMSMFFQEKILLMVALTSAIVGAISGINQMSMRKILAFSSIAHMGWIMSMMAIYSNFWIDYFLVYCITSYILCLSFWMFNINYFSQLTLTQDLFKKIIIFINLLSLGGVPPLLGFFPKWMAMMALYQNFPTLVILIFSSLVTLFFYTRLCFSTFTLYFQNNLWMLKMETKKSFYFLSFLTFFSLVGIFPIAIMSM
uniref:NADH-ubiquinone oxidoreductase chain 2 n=1 Tax=Eochionelasmus ohtai TaxID=1290545 RepID=A0A343SWE2_9CRUS|nr:NADH dehydrogenase subunit 2 [Eochionelasmus ohtai]AUT77216.1 NADH dehydrogenase subunit 2 [Eochionelasmus ohtai]